MQKNNELPVDVENMEHNVSSAEDIVTVTVFKSVDLSVEICTKIAGAPMKVAAVHERYRKFVKEKKGWKQRLQKLLGAGHELDDDEEKEGGKK